MDQGAAGRGGRIAVVETALRGVLWVLIFWLPFGSAVVESTVILAVLLWGVRRGWMPGERGLLAFFRRFRIAGDALALPVLGYAASGIFAAAGSVLGPAAWTALVTKTLEGPALFFLAREGLRRRRDLRIAAALFAAAAVTTSFDALIQYHGTGWDLFLHRTISRGGATAAFKHPNTLGGFLAFVFPAFVGYAAFETGRRRRAALGASSMAAWALGVTLSRGSWLAAAFGTAFGLSLSPRGRRWGLAFLAAAFGVAIVLGSLPPRARASLRLDGASLRSTVAWRWGVWKDGLRLARDRPFFGHGPNTFMRILRSRRRDTSPTYAHNCYVQTAAELGFVGLGCFLWAVGAVVLRTIRELRRVRRKEDTAVIALGALAGTMGLLAHASVDTDLYNIQLSALAWSALGWLAAWCGIVGYRDWARHAGWVDDADERIPGSA